MITVITGPPCAGKSTYAANNALPGDLIIDFDLIAQALGSTERHDHQSWIRDVAAAAWGSAVRQALKHHQRHSAWIIDSRPSREREADYKHARAKFVNLTADEPELHRRANQDGRTPAAHQSITRWLGNRPAADSSPTSRIIWGSGA